MNTTINMKKAHSYNKELVNHINFVKLLQQNLFILIISNDIFESKYKYFYVNDLEIQYDYKYKT